MRISQFTISQTICTSNSDVFKNSFFKKNNIALDKTIHSVYTFISSYFELFRATSSYLSCICTTSTVNYCKYWFRNSLPLYVYVHKQTAVFNLYTHRLLQSESWFNKITKCSHFNRFSQHII